MPVVRRAAVAGHFYPSQPEILRKEIRSYLAAAGPKTAALGCIVPHAGYMYSGHVAGAVYARMALPNRLIILCPNHTGMGKPIAVMNDGAWETPLGQARIDHELAAAIIDECPLCNIDSDAHRAEHATEVQIPFLQVIEKDFSFVPITVGVGAFESLRLLGQAIAKVVETADERILVVASSDMNHYASDAVTRIKDAKAIDRVLALDPQGLFEVVVNEEISMCGYGPAVAMLTASKLLGARSAELVKYATSGDISGDRNMVVGYAGVVVS